MTYTCANSGEYFLLTGGNSVSVIAQNTGWEPSSVATIDWSLMACVKSKENYFVLYLLLDFYNNFGIFILPFAINSMHCCDCYLEVLVYSSVVLLQSNSTDK